MINIILASVLNTSLIFSGQALDIASTQYSLSHCTSCHEGNPIPKNVLYTYKVSLAIGLSYTCYELEKHNHKKAARVIAIIGFIVPAAIAINNARVAK